MQKNICKQQIHYLKKNEGMHEDVRYLVEADNSAGKTQRSILLRAIEGDRITESDAVELFQYDNLGLLGVVANNIKEKKYGSQVFFNKNLHIEPTNICIYNCTFCTYSKKSGEEGCFETKPKEIVSKVVDRKNKISEVHIVGGVHPDFDLQYYCNLFSSIKKAAPNVIIKGLTAIELDYIFSKEKVSVKEGLER